MFSEKPENRENKGKKKRSKGLKKSRDFFRETPKFLDKFQEIRKVTESYINYRSYVGVVIPGKVA
ncbi:hypothetical protein [Methanosarcina barkeri]|uniref:hypothetical protein n=1 Tax=Methanosarcina barkeri TaxID=2208 RepID=UPI00064FEC39|nr:hypothetical protein [Methanosarcina barkeri]